MSFVSLKRAFKFGEFNKTNFPLTELYQKYIGIWGPVFASSPGYFKDTPLVTT